MKGTTIFSIIVATLAIAGIVMAFLGNASPYVTVKEAKTAKGAGVHVAGILDKSSLKTNVMAGKTEFSLSDESKESIRVVYNGPPVQNLTSADRVVAVGTSKDGVFEAEKLLVKCPSKYEGEQK